MRAHEIMDVPELLHRDAQQVQEDRWADVKARKPLPPKATPIAQEMDRKKRKAARNKSGPSRPTP